MKRKKKRKHGELFSFGEEKVRRRLKDLLSHVRELEIARHEAPGDLKPLARGLLEWLARWALYRGDGEVLPEGPPGYGDNAGDDGFTATLRARFGEMFRLTQELDHLMPAVLPSGTFEILRLYRRVHKLLDGEQPDWVLVGEPTDTPEGRREADLKIYEYLKEERCKRMKAIIELVYAHGPMTEDEIFEKLRERGGAAARSS